MLYTVDPSADEPIMLINQHIGFNDEDGQGISGSLFQEELLQLDTMNKKRIQIWISSPGGNVFEGMKIFHAMLNIKTKVDTYNCFMAASMAAVLFEAGRTRYMMDYALLMFHAPFMPSGEESDSIKEVLANYRASSVTAISQRIGKTTDEVSKMLEKDTWIGAQDAVTTGFADVIQESADYNKKRVIVNQRIEAKENPKVLYSIGKEIVQNLLSNDKNTTMSNEISKINMRLKLNDAAQVSDAIIEIDKIENRATTAEGKVIDLSTQITAITSTHEAAITEVQNKLITEVAAKDALKVELQSTKDKLIAMETDKKNAEEAAVKIEAKNMVEGFAKAGRIKNEETVKLFWIDLAAKDMVGTKAQLEALPLNKLAPVITVNNATVDPSLQPMNAMKLAVHNKLKREGRLPKTA